MDIENRMDRVEGAIIAIKELLANHDQRLDSQRSSFEESRKDFEFKWNALIDAQLQNETEIRELRTSINELRFGIGELRSGAVTFSESLTELKESTLRLRDASASQLKRIERLENN